MLLKKFVNLSLNLRTFSTQLNIDLYANNSCKLKNATKGKVRHISSHRHKKEEILHNPLHTVNIPVKVLECLLETNNQNISGKNVIDAANCLSILSKQENSFTGTNKFILGQIWYSLIDKHKDKLQITETIQILKQLVNLRIINSTKLIKIVLEIIHNSLKHLEFKDYNLLSDTLRKIKNQQLVETINEELKKSFVVKLSTEFDANNLDLLTEMFRYSSNNLNDKVFFKILVEALNNDNFEPIPIANAVSIMKSLCTVNPVPPKWDTLLKRIQDSIISNIDQVSVKDMQSLVFKIAVKVREERLNEFYNSSMLEHFSQQIVLNDIGFDAALNCLRNFISLRYVPKKLLSYLSAKNYEEMQKHSKSNLDYLDKLMCLVNGLAYLKLKPIFWDEIYGALNTHKILRFTDDTLVNYALNLSCLGHYDFAVLEHIFKLDYKYEERKFLHWRLLYLWQNLKTNSEYNGPLPPQRMIDSFQLLNRINNCPLLPNLNEILGSTTFFKTNVKTKLYHQIDHVIAFEGIDKPLVINENDDNTEDVQYLEDINVQDNTEIVALLYLPRWWYLENVKDLIGPCREYVQSLETLTQHVIVVPEQDWLPLSMDSRSDYLRNKINSKLFTVRNSDS